MTRRQASPADITPGAVVYIGNGEVAYRVLYSIAAEDSGIGKPCAQITKSTAKSSSQGCWKPLSKLTVEEV